MQVVLQPTAIATGGSGQAAKVTAAAGNKVTTKNGVGIFKDVQLSTEQPGSYILKAIPASREVHLAPCSRQMQPSTYSKLHAKADIWM